MKKLMATAAALLVAGGVATATAGSASAASYDQQDPYTTGCSRDATVVRSGPIKDRTGAQVGTIYLKWSANCGTNWSEADISTSDSGRIYVRASDGRVAGYPFGTGHSHVWGNMLYARYITAYGTISLADGSYGSTPSA